MRTDKGSIEAFRVALTRNNVWAQTMSKTSKDYFTKLASGQTPPILWIGCSDSRIPETTIMGLSPGDVFVHRNIANQVHATDINSRSVIEYAVKHVKVQHVVLSGHTHCSGVKAALANESLGVLDGWLHDLRALRQENLRELEALQEKERVTRLVELSVQRGVQTLKQNPTIIAAIKDRGLQVHGVIFDMERGELGELDTTEGRDQEKIRQTAFDLDA